MTNTLDPRSLLPLTPSVFQILLAIWDRERHGYGIMQEVKSQTAGRMCLGPGTLYGCLNRMLLAGLVEESQERPGRQLDDERRRYYRLSALGRRIGRMEAERLKAAVDAARVKRLLPGVRSAFAGGRPS
jgi:DNA-binding PadR family transcriptional regulator